MNGNKSEIYSPVSDKVPYTETMQHFVVDADEIGSVSYFQVYKVFNNAFKVRQNLCNAYIRKFS